MGLTVLSLELANPAAPDVTQRLDFLVDSGAIYSVVPRRILFHRVRAVLVQPDDMRSRAQDRRYEQLRVAVVQRFDAEP